MNDGQVTRIKPTKGWQFINWRELISYKDLLFFLTIRGLKSKYAQSVLGITWAIIQPLVTTLVFTVVFGRLAKISSDGTPYLLFSYIGLWPWLYFSGTLTDSSNSLVANAGMISKVYFPRLVLPLSAIFTKLLDFLISFVVLIVLLIWYKVTPSASVSLVPFLLVQLLLTSLGVGLFLSALAVQYRDIRYALTFLVQILMYSAPVVYSTTAVPDEYQFWYSLNPMVGVIEGLRAAFLGRVMPWSWILPGTAVSIGVFVFGIFSFRRMEKFFADVA